MTKSQAFFKTLVDRALREPRYADLLIKTMEQYELVKGEPIEGCIRIQLVEPHGWVRDIDDRRAENV